MPSNMPPKGYVRLNVNVPKELHMKLKMAATMMQTTMGEVIRQFIKDDLDKMLRVGLK